MDPTDPLTQVSPDDVSDPSDPLSQLADIRLPEDVGLWPLAPGWYVLAAVLLGLLAYALVVLFRVVRKRRILAQANRELELCLKRREQALDNDKPGAKGISDANLDYVNDVNAVLRRVALVHFPQHRVASLNGGQWLQFLKDSGDTSLLDDQTAQALSQGRFAPRCEVNPDALHAMAARWIRSLYTASARTDRITKSQPQSEAQTGHA